MNAPLLAEILTPREGQPRHPQQPLPLASAGVLRHVWESRFGPILIEVIGDQTFVNGDLVERAPLPEQPPRPLQALSYPRTAPRPMGPRAGARSSMLHDPDTP